MKDYYNNNGHYNDAKHYGGSGGYQSSETAKLGLNHGFQNGYNNGKRLTGYENSKIGTGFQLPYVY